jgi:hypothetical protein
MVVIPAHKPLGKGMLRTIIIEIDLSVEEFNKLRVKVHLLSIRGNYVRAIVDFGFSLGSMS